MSPPLRAPFPYYGSKIAAAPLIERLMGPINNLVVPFAGSLGELLGRSEPAKIETVNDADGLIVNAWRGLVYSPEAMAELCDHPVHEVTLHAAHDELIAHPQLVITLAGKGDEHDDLLAEGWTRHEWRSDGETIWASPGCLVDDWGPMFAEVHA